ncbi:MAG: hypothetical protein ABWY81_10920 [Jiangellaceae bacterium]
MSESWARAMLIAYDRYEKSNGKRQRVRAYSLGDGRWAYEAVKVRRPAPAPKLEPIVMTDELFRHLSETLPRCAQRARGFHGGGSKLAITDQRIAAAMGRFARQGVYLCELPAPAIGPHWHLVTKKKRRWPL